MKYGDAFGSQAPGASVCMMPSPENPNPGKSGKTSRVWQDLRVQGLMLWSDYKL